MIYVCFVVGVVLIVSGLYTRPQAVIRGADD